MPIAPNETGNRYGKLLVVSRDLNYQHKNPKRTKPVYWICKCDCGTVLSIRGTDLRIGQTKDCGCSKFVNEIGNRYGILTVIERTDNPRKKGGGVWWKLLCDCGNTLIVKGTELREHGRISCGCKSYPHKLEYGESSFRKLYKTYLKTAKDRDLEFSLSIDYFRKLTKQNCFYCGNSPLLTTSRTRSNGDYVYNGIDRFDNQKGYIVGNVVPCCVICNRMKLDHAYEFMIEHMKKVIAYQEIRLTSLALDGGDSAASEQFPTPEVLSTLQGESTPAHRK